MSPRRFALVAGGGTGGHVVPAVAVAEALAQEGGPSSVELVASRRGIDAELLGQCGLPVTLLPGRGLARRIDRRSVIANLKAVAGLAWALALALVLVGRRRPAVVVAMGGYASVPPALAAAVWGVPVVLVNVDAVPGAANRLVGRFARAVAVGLPTTAMARAVVTGVPVRPEIVAIAGTRNDATRQDARRALGLPVDRSVVGAVGGSLGAKTINEAVAGLVSLWAERDDVAIYHVVGRRNAPSVPAVPPGPSGLHYEAVPYENRMPLFYQAADVVVSRAGANTVAELTLVGVPSVLVPLPGAPGDHQSANARVLEHAGAAVVIEDRACSAERLTRELDALFADSAQLEHMATAAALLGHADAVEAVATLVRAHARGASRRGKSGRRRHTGGTA